MNDRSRDRATQRTAGKTERARERAKERENGRHERFRDDVNERLRDGTKDRMTERKAGMKVLVTICCRKGSKGLPHKNTRLMHGFPLIEHTIRQAEAWATLRGGAAIVVSSDDPTVKRLALGHGLWFVQRPAELATDTSGKVESIRHAWQTMEHRLNRVFDVTLDLDATNPLRRTEDIEAVYQLACGSDHPLSVFSVTKARRNPYFNMWPRTTEGALSLTRQESPQMYDLNCNIYGYSREFMLSERQHVITERSMIHVMPDWSAFDVDTETDWSIVEMLMKKYILHQTGPWGDH